MCAFVVLAINVLLSMFGWLVHILSAFRSIGGTGSGVWDWDPLCVFCMSRRFQKGIYVYSMCAYYTYVL